MKGKNGYMLGPRSPSVLDQRPLSWCPGPSGPGVHCDYSLPGYLTGLSGEPGLLHVLQLLGLTTKGMPVANK